MALYRMKQKCGRHRMRDGRLISPGDHIRTTPDELAGALDKFDVIEADPAPPPPVDVTQFRVIRRSPGWYDVVNAVSGTPVNDKAIRADAAAAMMGITEDKVAELADAELAEAESGEDETYTEHDD